jgi:hypothetical protein
MGHYLWNGGGKGSRTPDLVIANDALYQLSYAPFIPKVKITSFASP